jgi:SAM-dependent methyltransferase
MPSTSTHVASAKAGISVAPGSEGCSQAERTHEQAAVAISQEYSPPPNENWWHDFYGGLWGEFFLRYRSERENREEARQILRLAQITEPSRILDVPCGAGRVTVELAAEGHHVIGQDQSAELLERGRSYAAERGVSVQWKQRDMRDIPWCDRFDGVLCLNGSFGYFDDEQNIAFLESAARSLVSGGRLLIDGPTVETMLRHFESTTRTRAGEILLTENRRYDAIRGRLQNRMTLETKGEKWTATCSVRLYTVRELVSLLKDKDFAKIRCFGSLDGGPLSLNSERTIVVATYKPGTRT